VKDDTVTDQAISCPSSDAPPVEPVRLRAHRQTVKKLGPWTTERRFDVRGSQSFVCLDLLLAEIEPGDIEIAVDLDHCALKLLVPDGAVIDHADLRRVGRGRVKDWTGTARPGGRRIRLVGELRRSEVRIHRGGVALVSLVLSGAGPAVRKAERAGRLRGRATAG
jgi:hypothetical protein